MALLLLKVPIGLALLLKFIWMETGSSTEISKMPPFKMWPGSLVASSR